MPVADDEDDPAAAVAMLRGDQAPAGSSKQRVKSPEMWLAQRGKLWIEEHGNEDEEES